MYEFKYLPVDTEQIETKNRIIRTPIPSPTTYDILMECWKNEPESVNNQLPVVWDRAEDFSVYDNAGNKWIDFTSAIFVANIGHGNHFVKKAIDDVVSKGLLTSYSYCTKEKAKFSKNLLKKMPSFFDKVVFLSTGSEAVETAIKAAIFKTGRKRVVAFDKGFHGKTMGSAMACGKGNEWVPVESYVDHVPFPNEWDIDGDPEGFFDSTFSGINAKDVAAVIVEPYQGWSASFLPVLYAQKLRRWCTDNDVLLIIDEIQSGFGRTGKFFAYQHFYIQPDLIVCGKGVSSSLPLSCVISKSDIIDPIDKDRPCYSSTHGGNPVAVAASNASLNFLDSLNLVERSRVKGELLKSLLEEWKKERPQYIKRICGKGLLASVFIESPDGSNVDFVDRMIEIAMRKGLLSVRTMSGTLKIGPPLTITDEALIEGVNVLKESLDECLDM